MISRWRFSALDTWFFRESRPMESLGGSELQSGFPPSPRTLAGAIRHLVGKQHGVDWAKWNKPDEYTALKALIGDGGHYGKLRFSGPWLLRRSESGSVERLYPAPANLVAARSNNSLHRPVRLVIGLPRQCDLGQAVRMAQVAEADQQQADRDELKFKSLEAYWVTASTMQSLLSGKGCEAEELTHTKSVMQSESRLGIARSNISRTVEEGMLYQTQHVRPSQNLLLEMYVEGLSQDDYEPRGIVRLGGEGRGAAYQVVCQSDDNTLTNYSIPPYVGECSEEARGIILILLTPLNLPEGEGHGYSPLPGFACVEEAGRTVWKGALQARSGETVKLSLYCSVQGKAVREGGWDLAGNQPRAVQSLVPAGSVFYAEVDNGDIQAAIHALHLTQIAVIEKEIALGRGLVAVGIWPKNEWVDSRSK